MGHEDNSFFNRVQHSPSWYIGLVGWGRGWGGTKCFHAINYFCNFPNISRDHFCIQHLRQQTTLYSSSLNCTTGPLKQHLRLRTVFHFHKIILSEMHRVKIRSQPMQSTWMHVFLYLGGTTMHDSSQFHSLACLCSPSRVRVNFEKYVCHIVNGALLGDE